MRSIISVIQHLFSSLGRILGTHVVLFILAFILEAPVPLQAACPPLVKPLDMPLAEQVAKHTPTDRPLTDTELLKRFKNGDIKMPALQVVPLSGPLPLTVSVVLSVLSGDGPTQIEIDLDGSGTFKPVDARFNPHSGIQETKLSHTYESEGTFQMTLRIRDSQGGVTTHSKQVVVMSQAAFEASLHELWVHYKASLQRNDITSALECMHSLVRDEYRRILPEVLKSGTPINRILTDIRFQNLSALRAEFEMMRPGPRGDFSYLVVFEIDVDGVWRLRSM